MSVDLDSVAQFAAKAKDEHGEPVVKVADPATIDGFMTEAQRLAREEGRPPPIIDIDVETDGLRPHSGHRPFLFQFSIGATDDGGPIKPDGSNLIVEILQPGFEADRKRIQKWLSHPYAWYRAHNTKFDMSMSDERINPERFGKRFVRTGLTSWGFTVPPIERWHDNKVLCQLMDERISNALKPRAEVLFGPQAREFEKAVKDWLAAEKKRRRKAAKAATYDWLEARGLPQKRNRNPQVPPGLDMPDVWTDAEGEERHLRFVAPNYSDVPDEIMWPYAREDVVLTRLVWDWYMTIVPDSVWRLYTEIEQPVLGVLYEMERRGLPIDTELARKAHDHSLEQLQDRLEACRAIEGVDPHFNPDSSDQVAKSLRRRKVDMTYAGKTPTGRIKTDEDSLQAIDDDLARAVMNFRAEKKMYGTYLRKMFNDTYEDDELVPRFIAPDDRIHTFHWQVGAKTGRTSSSEPNVQNWHRDDLRLRHLVKAPPGNVLVAADMSTVEGRVTAFYAGPGALRDIFREGRDWHQHTATMVNLADKVRPGGEIEPARQRGKKLNYLLGYAGGVRAIRKWFHVPQAEAQRMKDAWYAAYPEVEQLGDEIQWRLADRGYIHDIYGRRYRLGSTVREEGYKFINYLVQGTAAGMIKEAMIKAHRQGVQLIGLYHDELLAECPPDEAEDVKAVLIDVLTDYPAITKYVPLEAEGEIAERWSYCKNPDYVPPYVAREVPLGDGLDAPGILVP